jgi:ankyrin repeat protein
VMPGRKSAGDSTKTNERAKSAGVKLGGLLRASLLGSPSNASNGNKACRKTTSICRQSPSHETNSNHTTDSSLGTEYDNLTHRRGKNLPSRNVLNEQIGLHSAGDNARSRQPEPLRSKEVGRSENYHHRQRCIESDPLVTGRGHLYVDDRMIIVGKQRSRSQGNGTNTRNPIAPTSRPLSYRNHREDSCWTNQTLKGELSATSNANIQFPNVPGISVAQSQIVITKPPARPSNEPSRSGLPQSISSAAKSIPCNCHSNTTPNAQLGKSTKNMTCEADRVREVHNFQSTRVTPGRSNDPGLHTRTRSIERRNDNVKKQQTGGSPSDGTCDGVASDTTIRGNIRLTRSKSQGRQSPHSVRREVLERSHSSSSLDRRTSTKLLWSKRDIGPPASKGAQGHGILHWHDAIGKHEWAKVEGMLKSYDYTKYRLKDSPDRNNKSTKRLRVLKYLTTNALQSQRNDKEKPHGDSRGARMEQSPLLDVDSNGRTPLHLACKEHMPPDLLNRLLFVERPAAAIVDGDGRRPLHVALINNLKVPFIDRLIYANPTSLGMPDHLNRTPLHYAILKAEHLRKKEIYGTWRIPTSKRDIQWQQHQRVAWETVEFILATMVKRRMSLSMIHERTVISECLEYFAPPAVVDEMISVGGGIFLEDANLSQHFVNSVLRLQYPIPTIRKVVEVTSKILSKGILRSLIHKGLIEHFNLGWVDILRDDLEGSKVPKSFGRELLHCYQGKGSCQEPPISMACQEWWDKLRFLLAYSSCRFQDMRDKMILHVALSNPITPPSLIDYLCRLIPSARYEVDKMTDTLPIHVASMYWDPTRSRNSVDERDVIRVLNLMVAGDFTLAQKRCNLRLPLHYACLSGKPGFFIQFLVHLDPRTIAASDPLTGLLPFQLAAIGDKSDRDRGDSSSPGGSGSNRDTQRLNMIFELLRMNPLAVSPLLSRGRATVRADLNKLISHIVGFCYHQEIRGSRKCWKLNIQRIGLLRAAIDSGQIPDPLRQWWSVLISLLWKAYDEVMRKNRSVRMPHNDEFILHAALWNADKIPPIAMELIVEIYHSSVHMIQPGTNKLPLQIAAAVPCYVPFSFESSISLGSALEMITLLDRDALRVRCTMDGRLPIHTAIASGKTWWSLRSMVEGAPETLFILDPVIGLPAFLLVSCKETFVLRHSIGRARTASRQWHQHGTTENARILRGLAKAYHKEKLTCIYEMLRAQPTALCLGG